MHPGLSRSNSGQAFFLEDASASQGQCEKLIVTLISFGRHIGYGAVA
jgi:hypothetical protein